MWNYAEEVDLDELRSSDRPSLIFKHSNSCAISAMALNRTLTQQDEIDEMADVYLVDVNRNRPTSLFIADELGITHESPQAILIKNGKVIYHASHSGIRPDDILSHL